LEEVRYANEALGLVYYDLKFYRLQEHLLIRAFFCAFVVLEATFEW
jgi:hypothetical protein